MTEPERPIVPYEMAVVGVGKLTMLFCQMCEDVEYEGRVRYETEKQVLHIFGAPTSERIKQMKPDEESPIIVGALDLVGFLNDPDLKGISAVMSDLFSTIIRMRK